MRCQDTALAPDSCHHLQETSLYGPGPRAHAPKTTAEPASRQLRDSRKRSCRDHPLTTLGLHSELVTEAWALILLRKFPNKSGEDHDSINPNFKSRMRLVQGKTCKNDIIENSAPVPVFRCQSPKQSQTKQKMKTKQATANQHGVSWDPFRPYLIPVFLLTSFRLQ